MLINQNKQTKYLLLNTNDKTDTTRWNIQNNNDFSQKIKMALVSINNATDTNLNMVFCPTIKDNYFSSLNTHPLIYSGIGYNTQNIINGKQYYDVNGAYFNEIELKTFSCPPQNNFSYPELDGLKPNLWLKFDTGAITTDYGTDNIYVYNINATPNAGVSVRGNDSVNFNGTTHYLTGTIVGINKGFSVSMWIYNKIDTTGTQAYFISFGTSSTFYNMVSFGINNNEYILFDVATSCKSSSFPNDLNNWVHLVWTYNRDTKERSIYRNGEKLTITSPIASGVMNVNTNFKIGRLSRETSSLYYYGGYMDDLRIYTGTVLTQDQINTIYGSRNNYPIIKNESYILPNDNDPNINTKPNLWCQFETGAIIINNGIDFITITNNGTTPNAGVSVRGNDSVSLNGTTQYLSGVISGISSSSFSVSAWTFNKSGLSSKGVIFSIGNQASQFKQVCIGFGIDYNYKYIFGFYSDDSVSTLAYPEDVNNWVHIVATYNSTTKERKFYRNGVIIPTTLPIATGQPTPITAFNIGRRSDGRHFNGNIDDLRVYTGKTLTQEEITRIYNGDKLEITEPVIGQDLSPNLWLKFDTGALLTNDGTDVITLTNFNASPNAGISIRGNNSISLNGTTQYLTGTGANLTNNGSFSISVWIYPKLLSAVAYNIVCQFYKTGQTFWVNFPNTYKYEFGVAGMNAVLTTPTFASDLNTWVHLVFTYNYTNRQILIYRNGVLLATSNNILSGALTGYENANFSIGATNSPVNYFNGNIDDLRTYNKILSQAQITELYAGNPYYNLPTALTRYNTDPTNTQYQFEVVDDEQKIISHY